MFRYLTPFSSSSENKSEFWLGTLFVIGLGILDFGIIMPTLAALLKHLQATPGVIELNFLAYIASKFHPLMLFYTKKNHLLINQQMQSHRSKMKKINVRRIFLKFVVKNLKVSSGI